MAETRRDLELMLDLSDLGDWRPPIVAAVATDGTGIADVWEAVEGHRGSIEKGGQLEQRRDERDPPELRQIVAQRLEARARELCRRHDLRRAGADGARAGAGPVGRHRRAAGGRRR